MTQPSKRFGLTTTILGAGISVAVAAHTLFAGQAQTSMVKQPAAMEPVAALTPFVEAHTHNQLPVDVRRKIGTENILHIFPEKPAASSANAAKN